MNWREFSLKCKDRKLWLNSISSAILWLVFPLILELSDSGRTEDGWASYWRKFPTHVSVLFTSFLIVAVIMHLLFAERVTKLVGRQFWIFPPKSPPIATSLYYPFWLIWALGNEGAPSRGFTLIGLLNLGYMWIVALAIVMFSCIWLTSPIAILNQFIIRRVYSHTSS